MQKSFKIIAKVMQKSFRNCKSIAKIIQKSFKNHSKIIQKSFILKLKNAAPMGSVFLG
jgi:hypothetical protein